MEEVSTIEKRLEKIETKLDMITDALIKLARAEEKLLSVEAKIANLNARLNGHSEKIEKVTSHADENARSLSFIIKTFWALFPILASALIYNIWSSTS